MNPNRRTQSKIALAGLGSIAWSGTILQIESLSFKLDAAGIEVAQYPIATSSDCYARADIIRLSAERADYFLEDAVYIGDGLGDFEATREPGIPFLGVGHRYIQFLDAGIVDALQTLEPSGFTKWIHDFRRL